MFVSVACLEPESHFRASIEILIAATGVYFNSFDDGSAGTQFITDATPTPYVWSFGDNIDTVNYSQPDNYADAYDDNLGP